MARMRRNAMSSSLRELSSHGHTCVVKYSCHGHHLCVHVPVSFLTRLSPRRCPQKAVAQAGVECSGAPSSYSAPSCCLHRTSQMW